MRDVDLSAIDLSLPTVSGMDYPGCSTSSFDRKDDPKFLTYLA